MPTHNVFRWMIGLLGLLLLVVTPYLWWGHANLLWIACPALFAWSVWLMMEYLRWAKTLGK